MRYTRTSRRRWPAFLILQMCVLFLIQSSYVELATSLCKFRYSWVELCQPNDSDQIIQITAHTAITFQSTHLSFTQSLISQVQILQIDWLWNWLNIWISRSLSGLVSPTDSTQSSQHHFTPESLQKSSKPRWPESMWRWGRLCQSMFAGYCLDVCVAAVLWGAQCGQWSASVKE